MGGLMLRVKNKKAIRYALCSILAVTVLVCVSLAFILLPKTDRAAFAVAVEDEDGLVGAITDAPTYAAAETVIEIEEDITVKDTENLTVIAGKNIRLTGDGVLTFEKPLTINAEAQVTFDVETVFDGKEGNLTVNGTLTVNSRLYNTAAITVANAKNSYAQIQSEGLIIGGSLNNDAENGGTITVNDGATLETRASTPYSVTNQYVETNHDGGTLMLKNVATDDGYTLGLEVKEGGKLTNNGSVIYEASPLNNGVAYYVAPCTGAVAAAFVNPDNLAAKEADNEYYLLKNQAGIYVLYAGISTAEANLLAGGNEGTGTINLGNTNVYNNTTVTLLAFGKITCNSVGGVRIQINNAHLNLGGNENITQGANELIFDGGAKWVKSGEVDYDNIDFTNNKGYSVIFYGEDNKPYYYYNDLENDGSKSDAVNQSNNNSAFFKIGVTDNANQKGSLSMYGGAKITNHEAAAGGIVGGGVCLGGNKGADNTFNMYGGEISWCAATGLGDNATGGAIYSKAGGTVNIFGGAVTHNALGNFGAKSADGAGIASQGGTVNMYGGEVSYNHGTLAASSDGGGIQVHSGAVLNLYGGEIYGNFSGGAGGGIAIYTSTVNMSGGTVRNNRAAFGGGINDIEGKLNISGGEIINNEAFRFNIQSGYGGGICTGNGDFNNQKDGIITIEGDVIISGNKAYYGGGIAVCTSYHTVGNNDDGVSNQLKMLGGTVIGNAAYELQLPAGTNYYATYETPVSANGGGVYVYAYKPNINGDNENNAPETPMLVLSGGASIDSSNSVSLNYDDRVELGVDGNRTVPIEVDGDLTASGLGALLYLNDNGLSKFTNDNENETNYPIIRFTNGLYATDYLDKFVLDSQQNHLVATENANGYITYNNSTKIVAQIKEGEATGLVNQDGYYEFTTLSAAFNAAGNGATIEIVRSTTISEGNMAGANNGRFYINKNITLKPASGKDVTLVLASTANFDQVDALFYVAEGGSFTLDGGDGRLTIDGNGSGRNNETGGKSNITLVKVNGGTFEMNGDVYLRDNVTNQAASAVEIAATGGTFIMNGGVIENNTSTNEKGSAVYIGNGTFTMNGGTIRNNVTDDASVGDVNFGVYLSGGKLELNGIVTFKDNQIYTSGSNIYVKSGFNTATSSQLSLVIPSADSLPAGTAIVHIAGENAGTVSKKFELFENPDVQLETREGDIAGYPTDLIVVRSVTYIFDPDGGKINGDLDELVNELKTKYGVEVFVRNTNDGLFILVKIKYGVEGFSVEPITDFYINNNSVTGAVQTISAWGKYGNNATLSFENGSNGEITLQATWADQTTVMLVDDDFGNEAYTIERPYTLRDVVDLNTANLEGFNFYRLGYEISGWTTTANTTVSGSFTVTQDLIKDGFITLTAVWEPINYSIRYVLNNDTLKEDPDWPTTYTVETTELDIPITLEGGDGYTFGGWYLNGQKFDVDKFLEDVENGEQTGDIILVALWQGHSYTVTFEPNGGRLPDGELSFTIAIGTTYTLPTPIRENYTFDGWYVFDKENGTLSEKPVTMSDTKDWTKDITLRAQWTAIEYTITLAKNDGTDATIGTVTYTVETEKIDLSEFTVSRDHYEFRDDWYTSAQCLLNQRFEYVQGTTGNFTLYAGWTPKVYTVKYYDSKELDFTTEYTVETQILQLITPTRSGYAFAGWYMDEGRTKPFTYEPGKTTGNFTLYAKWSDDLIKYTVTYDLNDGNDTHRTATYDVEHLTIDLPTETRLGYKFNGWLYNGETYKGTLTITEESLGDITLIAQWQAITYTVEFDVDGKADEIASKTISFGGETTVSLPAPQNITVGYTFGEWLLGTSVYTGSITLSQILATGVDIVYSEDGTEGTITFKAKWNLEQYTITYFPNNGGTVWYDSYTVETQEIELRVLERKGYNFLYWQYEGTPIAKPQEGKYVFNISGISGNITLIAQWEVIPYTITYVYGDGRPNTTGTYTVENKTIELIIPERSGYTFKGWKYGENTITADENGKYVIGQPDPLANIELTAQWEVIEYTITLDYNGGTGDIEEIKYTVETESVDLPLDLTRKDYDFKGWFIDITLTTRFVYTQGMTTGSLTLYAKWEAITYNIEYELDGGTNNDANPETYTVETAEITLYPATREGYTFDGWYVTNEDGTLGDLVTKIAQGSKGDIVLTAQWAPITYKISYDLNGGINHRDNPATYTVETASLTLKDPVRTGYKFDGWYIDKEFNTEFTYEPGKTTGNLTLYAKWDKTPINYTVVYLAERDDEEPVDTQEYNIDNTTITFDVTTTKTGYTFSGWKLLLKGNELSDEIYSGSVSLRQILNNEDVAISESNEITFVAQWTVTTYYITYVLNGGKINEANPATYTVETESLTLKDPVRTGYKFDSWFTDEDCTIGFEYTPGTTVGNLVLYAKWNAAEVQIKISAGNGTFNKDGNDFPENCTVNEDGNVILSVYYDAQIYSELIELQKYLVAPADGSVFIAWDMESVLASYYYENNDYKIEALYSSEQIGVTLIFLTGEVTTVLIDKGTEFTTEAYNHTTGSGYTGNGWKYYNSDVDWEGDGKPLTISITLQEKQGDALTYTVTFKDGDDERTDNVVFGAKYGDKLPTLTKAGYTFLNWTDENGNVITADTTVSIPNDHVLTANWILTSYTIIFELDGGNGNVATLTGQTIENSIDLVGVKRLGYTFDGWTVDKLTGNKKVSDLIYYAEDGTNVISLTAQWTANEYTLKFEGAEEVKLKFGATEKVNPSVINAGTKDGYTFDGWSLDGVIYNVELSLEEILLIVGDSDTDIIFTAQWSAKDYEITYELNIADDSASKNYINPNPVTYTVEDVLDLQPATRDGYDFLGWYTDEDCTTVFEYQQGTTSSNLTLYAKWALKTYNITYNLNGGAYDGINPATTYTVEDEVTLPIPVRSGYTFLGWFVNGNQVSSIAKGSRLNYTFEAKWSDPIAYAVIYELDGGTNHRDNPTSYTVNTTEITLNNPTRAGYSFVGWEYNGTALTDGVLKLPEQLGDVTLTARWKAIAYQVVLVDSNITINTMTVEYSDNATVTLGVPETKDGYTFLGWQIGNSTYNGSVLLSNLMVSAVESDDGKMVITLTAVWSGLPGADTYNIIYELNGGTLDQDGVPHSYSPIDHKYLTEVIPAKEYHVFLGWYNNPDCTGEPVESTYDFAEDMYLYAKWQREEIELKGSIENWTYGETPKAPVVEGGYSCIFLYGTENDLNGVWSATVPTDAYQTYYVLMYVKYDGDSTAKPVDENDKSGWCIVEFSIARKAIAAPELKIISSGAGKNDTYTGSDLAAFILNFDSVYMTISYDGTITTADGFAIHATNADDYKVTITLVNSNYFWYGEENKTSLELVWTIAKQKVALPTANDAALRVNGKMQTYLPVGFDSAVMGISGNREAFGGTFTATVWLLDTNNYEWEDGTVGELTFEWTMGGINKLFVIITCTLGGLCVIAGALALTQVLAGRAKKKRAEAEVAARSAAVQAEVEAAVNNAEGADAQDNAEAQNADGGEETK